MRLNCEFKQLQLLQSNKTLIRPEFVVDLSPFSKFFSPRDVYLRYRYVLDERDQIGKCLADPYSSHLHRTGFANFNSFISVKNVCETSY